MIISPKVTEHPHVTLGRRKLDTNEIRNRLQTMGWETKELPIRRASKEHIVEVVRWKLIGIKGEKSIEVAGSTLDEAMKNLGVSLGAIPKE